MKFKGPIWLMQPIPYFGENLDFKEWIWEPKIDGWRMQIIKYKNQKVEFYGRRLEANPNWTPKLKYLINIVNKFLPNYTLLDSELYSSGGRRFIPSLFAQQPKVKPIIFVFDIIFLKGQFLGDFPLWERRKLLEGIKFSEPFYIIQQNQIIDLSTALRESLNQGHEGIVIKQVYSKYRISEDGPIATEWWRKIKN